MSVEFAYGYKEYKESGNEHISFTGGGKTYRRVFKGPWEHRHAFINEVLAEGTIDNDDGEALFVIGRPHPDDPNTFVADIDIVGSGKTQQETSDSNSIKHDRATITANYQSYNPGENPTSDPTDPNDPKKQGIYFIEEEISAESEILELETLYQYKKYLKAGSLIKVPAVGTKRNLTLLQYLNYTIRIPIWIEPDWTVLQGLTGQVNSDPLSSKTTNLIFPAKTLHFLGPSGATQRSQFNGKTVWSLDLVFKYNPNGWHRRPEVDIYDDEGFLLPDKGLWSLVELDPAPYFFINFFTFFPYFFDTLEVV